MERRFTTSYDTNIRFQHKWPIESKKYMQHRVWERFGAKSLKTAGGVAYKSYIFAKTQYFEHKFWINGNDACKIGYNTHDVV